MNYYSIFYTVIDGKSTSDVCDEPFPSIEALLHDLVGEEGLMDVFSQAHEGANWINCTSDAARIYVEKFGDWHLETEREFPNWVWKHQDKLIEAYIDDYREDMAEVIGR